MEKVYEFLKKAGVYYLATVEGDQPRVRPFGTYNIFENKLYIQTGKVKPCSKPIRIFVRCMTNMTATLKSCILPTLLLPSVPSPLLRKPTNSNVRPLRDLSTQGPVRYT